MTRTLDDEANHLREIKKYLDSALEAVPHGRGDPDGASTSRWTRVGVAVDEAIDEVKAALKEIGA